MVRGTRIRKQALYLAKADFLADLQTNMLSHMVVYRLASRGFAAKPSLNDFTFNKTLKNREIYAIVKLLVKIVAAKGTAHPA